MTTSNGHKPPVRVRYVGARDPLVIDGERVRAAIAAGRMGMADVEAFNARRLGGPKPGGGHYPVTAAIPGVTTRILGPAEGLSRTYIWGPAPWDFVQAVENDDWLVIQGLPEAAHFTED
ncbi:MAG TPA: hypothetical protein VH475_22175 [Tepidisphaeraceae bacterium]